MEKQRVKFDVSGYLCLATNLPHSKEEAKFWAVPKQLGVHYLV